MRDDAVHQHRWCQYFVRDVPSPAPQTPMPPTTRSNVSDVEWPGNVPLSTPWTNGHARLSRGAATLSGSQGQLVRRDCRAWGRPPPPWHPPVRVHRGSPPFGTSLRCRRGSQGSATPRRGSMAAPVARRGCRWRRPQGRARSQPVSADAGMWVRWKGRGRYRGRTMERRIPKAGKQRSVRDVSVGVEARNGLAKDTRGGDMHTKCLGLTYRLATHGECVRVWGGTSGCVSRGRCKGRSPNTRHAEQGGCSGSARVSGTTGVLWTLARPVPLAFMGQTSSPIATQAPRCDARLQRVTETRGRSVGWSRDGHAHVAGSRWHTPLGRLSDAAGHVQRPARDNAAGVRHAVRRWGSWRCTREMSRGALTQGPDLVSGDGANCSAAVCGWVSLVHVPRLVSQTLAAGAIWPKPAWLADSLTRDCCFHVALWIAVL